VDKYSSPLGYLHDYVMNKRDKPILLEIMFTC
jgi:hypothetical protein